MKTNMKFLYKNAVLVPRKLVKTKFYALLELIKLKGVH